ncbi:MAG: ABC transporter permease [Candidatus Bathyarchaeia archaeon]
MVIFIVTVLIFLSIRLLPGDPLIIYLGQAATQLGALEQDYLEKLRRQFGLDKPLAIQYLNWVSNIFKGNFGRSVYYQEDVRQLLRERFPVTIHLGILSLMVSAVLGITIGTIGAVRRGKVVDSVLTVFCYIGISVPVFWLGILLIYILSVKFNLLPVGGYTSPFKDFWLSTKQILMPVFCLSFFGIAANARQMRSSMLEVMRQDYIKVAWAKGLSEWYIIRKHALKNALIPVVTLIGTAVPVIFGGSVLVETVFAIPGVGRLLVESIFGQDYVVVQSVTFIITLFVVVSNLFVDIFYAWLDPRIRYE